VWYPTNEFGLANCRTDMLRSRPSDKLVVAATHGRGMYSSDYSTLLDSCQVSLTLPGNVASGLYMASEFVSSDGTVAAESTVIFQAGEYVELLVGFTAERGSNFWALIKDCTPGMTPLQSPDPPPMVYAITPPPPQTLLVAPNPARDAGAVQFSLEEEGRARLYLMNVRGELVVMLADGILSAGLHRRDFSVRGMPPGVYLVVLKTTEGTQTERVVIIE
jgi:hypothetical protein